MIDVGIFKVGKDMSQAKKQDFKNHEFLNNNQTGLILNSLSEGICQLNAEGEIMFANPSVIRMIGLTEQSEIIGKHYKKVFYSSSKKDEDEMLDPIQFALLDGETSHVNTETFYQQDGTDFLVEYVCVPIIEDEIISGAVISFTDVTERRDVEVALTKARDAALEAAEAKAAFLANMSHEIRTPLNGIVGTTGLLLDSELSNQQKHYVKMLKTSTDLLLHIVNDILDFSKIEAGRFQIEEVEFDIHEVTEDLINVFSPITKDKKIDLSFEFQGGISNILYGDVNKIRQIINNFLSNAIKFTEEGSVVLRVENANESQDEITLKFSVEDSGIGIDEEIQTTLFQPFTQADASTTRRFGGTGLGLAICKYLVEIMHGEIGLSSRLGKGSTFWFTAKFKKSFLENVQVLPESVDANKFNENKKQISRSDLKVLVVEDNPINREVTQKVLEQIGISSEIVENGLEAVKTCLEKDFDLVFMDCQMPKMDGFEATAKIRDEQSLSSELKIVALTASATVDERQNCFKAGMDDYLSKPFTKEDLEKIFNKYFDIKADDLNLDLETNIVQHSLAKIIEPNTLQSFLEIEASGEEGFISEILNVFLHHSDEKFSELKEALSEKKSDVIKQNAHNLKGSSANTGLADLSKSFAELEEKLKTQNWDIISKQVENISEKLRSIKNLVLENNIEVSPNGS